jgi:hypothetical protein
MRILGGFGIALLLSTGLFAQFRGNAGGTPARAGTPGFGSVVFPGGTPATMPNVTRTFGSVVNPGFGGPPAVTPRGTFPIITSMPTLTRPTMPGQNPGGHPEMRNPRRHATAYVYAYPVYVGGGYYDNGYGPYGSYPPYAPEQAPVQQQPNITVIYPPQAANPVMITRGPDGNYTTSERPMNAYQPPPNAQAAEPDTGTEASHYLIAFKDHTIYAAVAYWVDGETLHYFTSGNTHNQVSLSLIDREMTERLNKESGIDFRLPAAK